MSEQQIEGFRLSANQKRAWERHDQVAFAEVICSLNGQPDLNRLHQAVLATIANWEILFTRFSVIKGMSLPIQVIEEEPEVSFIAQVESFAEVALPDVDKLPVVQVLVRSMAQNYQMCLRLPLACTDSRSLDLLLQEIWDRYNERPIAYEEMDEDDAPIQYADFAEWQHELLEEEDAQAWQDLTCEDAQDCVFPWLQAASEPYQRASVEGEVFSFRDQAIKDLDEACTPQAFFFTCWRVFLARHCEMGTPLVGLEIEGRKFEPLQAAQGLFAKLLPTQFTDQMDSSFAAVLKRSQADLEKWLETEEYYAADRITWLRDQTFDFGMRLEQGLGEQQHGDLKVNVTHKRVDLEPHALGLVIQQLADGSLRPILNFDCTRLDEQQAQYLVEGFQKLVEAARHQPELSLSQLPLVGESERQRLKAFATNGSPVARIQKSLPQVFEDQVARTPNVDAVVFGDQALTFAELNRKANQLAHALKAKGANNNQVIPICMTRSIDLLVAIVGILKADCAFLPLEPAQPESRIEAILADAAPKLIVADPGLESLVSSAAAEVIKLNDTQDCSVENPDHRSDGDQLAYVLYTSGSTGTPKGVMVRQSSVLNLVLALQERIYGQQERALKVGLNAPFSFDASVKQWALLLLGHSIYLVADEIRPDGQAMLDFLAATQLDALDGTPSLVKLMLDAGLSERAELLPDFLLLGGEAIDTALWQKLDQLKPGAVYNVYGPTECTVDTTCTVLEANQDVHMGTPLTNVEVFVVDAQLQQVPIGHPGELCIGGAGLARGYLGNPAVTADKFVPNPFGAEGSRIYRSGDLVRFTSEGRLQFEGRIDHQVKIRGFRVELGEIEHALRQHPAVHAGVVRLRKDDQGNERLVAYAVPKPGAMAKAAGKPRHLLPNGLAVIQQNPNETDYLYEEIFAKDTYFHYGIELPEDAVVFDIGANIGMFSLCVRLRCPSAQIYAFEPLDPIYACLEANTGFYGGKVKLFNYGLSSHEHREDFLYYPGYSMMSGQSRYAKPEEEVDVVKRFLEMEAEAGVDGAAELLANADELLAGRFEGQTYDCLLRRLTDVIRETGVERIHLLKVDVQRAEMDVLAGMSDADWDLVDQVVMEVHQADDESINRVAELSTLLEKHGFDQIGEQDPLLVGTDRYNFYASRKGLKPKHEIVVPPADELILEANAPLSSKPVRDFLKTRLPEYMVPSHVMPMELIPLNRNGKVDDHALPAPKMDSEQSQASLVAASTPTEEMLLVIWREVLAIEQISVEDNFFELGGHSLIATQLMARVRSKFAIEMPLRTLFASPTIRALAKAVDLARGGEENISEIAAVDRNQPLPLSFSQQRLWFIDQMEPGQSVYNCPLALRLEGELNVTALEQSLSQIVARHESLRTVFDLAGQQPVQIIKPSWSVSVPVQDFSSLTAKEKHDALEKALIAWFDAPFNLSEGPLFRCQLIQLDKHDHVLAWVIHHIVGDAFSNDVLQREFSELYAANIAGRAPELPELAIQYADYAVWQRTVFNDSGLQKQLDYWQAQLAGQIAPLALPTDFPRPPQRTYAGAVYKFHIEQELYEELQKLSQKHQSTLHMTLLTGFASLLHRLSGQTDICVGTPVAGRTQEAVEPLIGFFINTLVMRLNLEANPVFTDLLEQVRETALDAYANQDVPFEKLVETLQPQRSLSHSPFFQTMFQLLEVGAQNPDLGGVTVSHVEVPQAQAKFDLMLDTMPHAGGLNGYFTFNTDLFSEGTVVQFAAYFKHLLVELIAHPQLRIGDVNLLNELLLDDLDRLLRGKQQTLDFGPDWPSSVAKVARANPERIAVEAAGQVMTYAELMQLADQVTGMLQAEGVRAETVVALFMDRTPQAIAAMLGIMRAGAAFLPMLPSTPAQRQRVIIEEADVNWVLTRQALQEEWHAGQRLLTIEFAMKHEPLWNEESLHQHQLAYVLYTSGSSGRPKGVMVTHGAVCNLASALKLNAYHDLKREGLRVGLNAPFVFDASVQQLIQLGYGHTLILLPEETRTQADQMLSFLRSAKLDVLDATPSHMEMLLAAGLSLNTTGLPDRILIGGEAIKPDVWKRLSDFGARCHNVYGPTEATVDTTHTAIEAKVQPHLGLPLANICVHIVSTNLQLVPVGVSGELCIGGVGLARGYQARPELTAAVFIPDPFSQQAGARLYRTGDLVRLNNTGHLEFIGRIDQQVKLRGHRIELGEIEAVLSQCAQAEQVAVKVFGSTPPNMRLVAFMAAAKVKDQTAIKAALQKSLPEYMVPAQFVMLEKLPLTINGKVDRRALPEPQMQTVRSSGEFYDQIEVLVAQIWADALAIEQVQAEDDFFEIGGHSLIATQVMMRLQKELDLDMPMRHLFEAPVLRDFSARVRNAKQTGVKASAPLVPLADSNAISFAQQRIWFIQQMDPDSSQYNMLQAYQLRGKLNHGSVRKALASVLDRHRVLRTVFQNVQGKPRALVLAEIEDVLSFVDLSKDPDTHGKVAQLLRAEGARPFDMSQSVMRMLLIQTAPDHHVMALNIHHIAGDAWSTEILLRDFCSCYNQACSDQNAAMLPLPLQYSDFAAWQTSQLVGERRDALLEYWRNQIGENPAPLQLPTDFPRPAVPSHRGDHVSFVIPADLVARLRSYGQAHQATLFMTLLSGFKVLLQRYSQQDRILVGTPIAGRNHADLASLVGCFVNTLVMADDIDDQMVFEGLLKQVRQNTLDAFAHQELPFEMLVDALQPQRDTSVTPLFQVMFVMQQAVTQRMPELQDVAVEALASPSATAKFDLTLTLIDDPEQQALAANLNYACDLFKRETVERMAQYYVFLLEQALAQPQRALRELPLTDQIHLSKVSKSLTPGEGDLQCMHLAFEQMVRSQPNQTAVVFEDVALTYAELDRQANQLAHILRQQGVSEESIVGLCLPRSQDLVVGLLAILKAGGAYLPLDPDLPQDRLNYMVQDAAVQLVLVNNESSEALKGLQQETVNVATVDLSAMPTDAPASHTNLDSACYLLYTSGSTGHPKGTLVTHRNVARLLQTAQPSFDFNSQDVWTLFHSIAFDFSVWEFWGALANGGQLVVVPYWVSRDPAAFLSLLQQQKVTVLNQTPSAFKQLLAACTSGNVTALPLRYVIFGGEALEMTSLQPWFERFGSQTRMINMYGITETCVHVTFREVGVEDLEQVGGSPLGEPLPDLDIYLLDAHLKPVAPGVCGEICVAGEGLARGYWNRADLTAQRFVPHPFSEQPGARLYRSGDLGRLDGNNQLMYMGRIDQQVKVRGFRIELGEIEQALLALDGIEQVAVIARTDLAADTSLVAYLVANSQVQEAEVRAQLAQRLPAYMVPAYFVNLPELPLTSNGKLDRRALPQPATRQGDRQLVSPRTEVEKLLSEVWCKVLNLSEISIEDNFFALGGDSILSLQVVSGMARRGYRITPRDIFTYQTVAELAGIAEPSAATFAEQGLVSGDVLLAPIQQWFFAQHMEEPSHFNQSLLFDCDQPLRLDLLQQTCQQLVAHHDGLRLRFEQQSSGWQQTLTADMPTDFINHVDLKTVADSDLEARFADEVSRIQASIDLNGETLLRIALFEMGERPQVAPQRLLIAIHHLAVDGVSWRILMEDFQNVYSSLQAGQMPLLPEKTTSYKTWSEGLVEQAQKRESERSIWQDHEPNSAFALVDTSKVQAATYRTQSTVQFQLSSAQTQALLQDANNAFQTRTEELLLTASALAFREWKQLDRFQVDMESHGRDAILEGMDLSRTVGWFTAIFPFAVDMARLSIADVIVKVKERLRAIPDKGVGYGMLAYLGNSVSETPAHNPVSFNYLGQFDQAETQGLALRPSAADKGANQAAQNRMPHVLGLTSQVYQGRMQWTLAFASSVFDVAEMQHLSELLQSQLLQVIETCTTQEDITFTPSDFPMFESDSEDFAQIAALLDED